MDLFISYRRDSGIDIARNMWNELKERNYYSFFDIDSIREGAFPELISQNILRAKNFLLILSPKSLDRCISEDDWVRRELATAFQMGKNIIPVTCMNFSYPETLPAEIGQIRFIQAIDYNGVNIREVVEKIIERLKDDRGEALRLSKIRNVSNTFYADGHMSEEERKRIWADYESCKCVETDIFNRLLEGKKGVSVFNPAIYDIDSYMSKYSRPEIEHVYGLLNSPAEARNAEDKYGVLAHQRNAFYPGNMEHENFEDEMDKILADHSLTSFDFVDLTLILRDLVEPEEKLRQVVQRVRSGGVVYVRELDHGMALAYPDDRGLFKKMLSLIKRDDYSGDYEAGRKVYFWMKNADLTNLHFEGRQISTVGMKRRERRILFDALFSYVEREYRVMHEKEPTTDTKRAIEWLQENYKTMESLFANEDFFFSSGFMEFYGYAE